MVRRAPARGSRMSGPSLLPDLRSRRTDFLVSWPLTGGCRRGAVASSPKSDDGWILKQGQSERVSALVSVGWRSLLLSLARRSGCCSDGRDLSVFAAAQLPALGGWLQRERWLALQDGEGDPDADEDGASECSDGDRLAEEYDPEDNTHEGLEEQQHATA